MRKLIYILFFASVFSYAQQDLLLASQQQFANEGGSPTNLYIDSNALSDDSNSLGDWTNNSQTSVTVVASTDAVLGDNYAIRYELTQANDTDLRDDITNLTIGQAYKATIRARQPQGGTGNVFFNWNGVTSTTYPSAVGTTWGEYEVFFTANSATVGIKLYIGFGTNTIGDYVEVSSIIIEEV